MNENIFGYEHEEWKDSIKRFKNISNFAMFGKHILHN